MDYAQQFNTLRNILICYRFALIVLSELVMTVKLNILFTFGVETMLRRENSDKTEAAISPNCLATHP